MNNSNKHPISVISVLADSLPGPKEYGIAVAVWAMVLLVAWWLH